MDLTTLDTGPAADAGVDVQLKHPVSGAPLPVWITVYGRDSRIYHDKQLELQRRRLELAASGRGADGDTVQRTLDESTELLAAVTKGWRELELDGGPCLHSEKAARALYARHGLRWIREQVDEAVHTRALFLPGGATP